MLSVSTKFDKEVIKFEFEGFNEIKYFKSLKNDLFIENKKNDFNLENINYETFMLIIYYQDTKTIDQTLLSSNIINDLLFLGYEELIEKITNLNEKILLKYNLITKKEIIEQILKDNKNDLIFDNYISFEQFIKTGDTQFLTDDANYGFIHMLEHVDDELQNTILELDDININLQDKHKNTILISCIKNINNELLNKLLKKNTDLNINLQDKHKNTILMSCIKNINNRLLNKLLKKNPDLNIQNKNWETALMIPCKIDLFIKFYMTY